MSKVVRQLTPNEIEELKPYVFTPCKTKKALHDWIFLVLGYDLPDATIDPSSNSNPMDLIWEIYDIALKGGHPDYSQVLAYAAREAIKTLAASILEVLGLVHLRRSASHMAAIKQQSKKSQDYVKRMLNRPLLRDYVTSKNDSVLEITRYIHYDTGENIPPKVFEALPTEEQKKYEEVKNSIAIVVATIQSANGQHSPLCVVDELDVIESKDAYEEAKMIATEAEDGGLPVTLITSTRKYSFGLVQAEIDNAPESKLQIRHWNIIDVTKRCLPERHLPDQPEIPVYFSDDLLKTVSEDEYKVLEPEQKIKYQREMASPGCIQNCKIYAACRGRLKNQPSDSLMLKKIEHVQAVFNKVSLQRAQAQLLCKKPSTEGLIYPNFDYQIHMLTAAQIAKMLTNDDFEDKFSKADLIKLIQEREIRFTGGMDFGTTHCFATVYGFKFDGNYFVLGGHEVPGLEPTQQIDLCRADHEYLNIAYYPDTAMPGTIRMFRKAGFTMFEWEKKKNSVVDGIDIVRSLFLPSGGAKPRLFFLKGDQGCESLARRVSQYHWKKDSAGRHTDIPDEEDDDQLDALRYCVMNQFTNAGKVIAAINDGPIIKNYINPGAPRLQQDSYLTPLINEALGRTTNSTSEDTGESSGKSGKLHWSF